MPPRSLSVRKRPPASLTPSSTAGDSQSRGRETCKSIKLFIHMLRRATLCSGGNQWELEGQRFVRAWLQGVVVEVSQKRRRVAGAGAGEPPQLPRFLLDDGTGAIWVSFKPTAPPPRVGALVSLLGPVVDLGHGDMEVRSFTGFVSDVSDCPDKESLWVGEVVDQWRRRVRLSSAASTASAGGGAGASMGR